MARFVAVTDKDIDSFSEEQENENTKRTTFYDIKVFLEFLHSESEARNIHEIPPKELNNFAKKFASSVRKRNGEEYEAIRAFLQSIDCHLCKNGYPLSLLNDREFQDILKKKQKQLKSIGKGKKKTNSEDPQTDEK